MPPRIDGKLLRVFVGENDKYQGHPVHKWILNKAREQGLAGATVLRGLEGFGTHSRLHTTTILRLSSDLPVVIEIIDTEAKIEAFFPFLNEAVDEGLVTVEKVEAWFFRPTSSDAE